MGKAYFGPGSAQYTTSGSLAPGQRKPAPVVHAIANPPFHHSDMQYPNETGNQYFTRIFDEYNQRGQQQLPQSWDVQRPGGAGYKGTGLHAQPSPFLFPGQLPAGGVTLPNGQTVTGSINGSGSLTGQITGGPGAGSGVMGSVSGGNLSLSGPVSSGSTPGAVKGGSPTTASFAPTGAGQPTGAGNVAYQGTPQSADQVLAEQRALAFDRLRENDRSYSSPFAQELQGAILDQLRGDSQPFGEDTMNRMLAMQRDQVGAQERQQLGRIRDSFAARGLGRSGMALGAELEARQNASAQRGNLLNQALIEQAMQNFNARERAQGMANSFLGGRAAAITPAMLKEADLRSRFEVTGQGEGDAGLSAIAQAIGASGSGQGADSPFAENLRLPLGSLGGNGQFGGVQGRVTGNDSQYGGVTWLNSPIQPFMQTSGSTSYPQMGLGGAAGPFGAVSDAQRIASENMRRSGQSTQGYHRLGGSGGGLDPSTSPLTVDQQRKLLGGGGGGMGDPIQAPLVLPQISQADVQTQQAMDTLRQYAGAIGASLGWNWP